MRAASRYCDINLQNKMLESHKSMEFWRLPYETNYTVLIHLFLDLDIKPYLYSWNWQGNLMLF